MVLLDRCWMRCFVHTPTEYVSSQNIRNYVVCVCLLLSYIHVGKYSGSVMHFVFMKR